MNVHYIASLLIFAATIIAVEKRPSKIGIGYPPVIGGIVCLVLGITPLRDLIVIWNIVWNSTFTFVAIIIYTLILEEAGFFSYVAIKFVRFAGGSSRKAFVLLIVLGSILSGVFANDGAILILTPIVYSILKHTRAPRSLYLPFLFSIGFIADTASSPLVISNLVNIITASYFRIEFVSYAEVMILPAMVAAATSLAMLYILYRKSLNFEFKQEFLPKPESVIKDRVIFSIAVPFTVFLMAAYAITGFFSIPIAFIAVPGALILLGISGRSRTINTLKVLKEAPWHIVYFSLGMYVIVFGMGYQGLDSQLSSILVYLSGLGSFASIVLSGLLFSFLAGILNNLPSVMIGNLSIAHAGLSHNLAFANVVGNDIGPKFTPIGSLATLLWIYSIEKKGDIKISWKYYMKVGSILTLPVLLCTLVTLWFVTAV